MQPLPIGINTLSIIREQQMVYVDKTPLVYALAQRVSRYFLSRPRRFGKSLLVDTFKELFEGNRALFSGLYIEDKWDWSKTYPVIKIDFATGHVQSLAQCEQRITQILNDNAKRLGCELQWDPSDVAGRFGELIHAVRERYQQRVVILVDEYDKPILDNIEHVERACEIRDGLKNLYSVMKGYDADIQFVFMTGVSKFSKVSLFSGLNQLQDISLHPAYASLCGYTHTELQHAFAEHLADVDWAQLQQWYNGYNFMGDKVYNPYDILLFISSGYIYRNYWFETGSPSFLIKLFQQRHYFLPALETVFANESLLDSFDVERINPVTLLFQAGYLTLSRYARKFDELSFELTIPNREVRMALNNKFIDGYTQLDNEKMCLKSELYDCLSAGDLASLRGILQRLFASIPWRNFTQNELAQSEGYYASVLYAFFSALNAQVTAEDITNQGQVDLTVQVESCIYVMEIKRVLDWQAGSDNTALAQIQARQYSQKYQGIAGTRLFEVGLVFDASTRNLAQLDWIEH